MPRAKARAKMGARKASPAGAKEPKTRCPFTGVKIDKLKLGNGFWMGRVSSEYGGYTTTLFETEQELDYFISIRGGIKPQFKRRDSVVVAERKRERPDELGEEMKDRERELNDGVQDCIERAAHESLIR